MSGGADVALIEDIPQGHKFAFKGHLQGDEVVKIRLPHRLGQRRDHSTDRGYTFHNVKTALERFLTYDYKPEGAMRDGEPTGHTFFEGLPAELREGGHPQRDLDHSYRWLR